MASPPFARFRLLSYDERHVRAAPLLRRGAPACVSESALLLALVVSSPPPSRSRGRADARRHLRPAKRIDFGGGAPAGLTWISDTQYLWPKPGNGGVEWLKVEAASGTSTPLFEAKAASDRAAEALGLDSAVIGQALSSRGLEMNPARTAAVVAIDNDLYYVPFGTQDRAQRLTSTVDPEEEFTFSPDGELVELPARQRPLRRRRRSSARAAPDHRRRPATAERQARLGLPGRDLRPRQLPRLLVEPRLPAPRVPAARRAAGARVHRRRSHPAAAHRRDRGTTRRPAIRIPA